MTLFINACVRADSRTKRLAERLLGDAPRQEVLLHAVDFPTADEAFLDRRERLLRAGAFDDPMFDLARQFAAAEEIVIAAPFWDLSFPAALKQYFEQINVVGITFFYTAEGIPQGLCRAGQVTYVTTAGGYYFPEEFGPGYVRALCRDYYGISGFRLVKALGLDIDGADPDAILAAAMEELSRGE